MIQFSVHKKKNKTPFKLCTIPERSYALLQCKKGDLTVVFTGIAMAL